MRALITGITGQIGSYLAELLLSQGYEVHGVVRRASTINTSRIDHLYKDPHEPDCRLFLHYGDMTESLHGVVAKVKPDEVYNLAAQSHVRVSFDQPEYTHDVVAGGTMRLLEAVRQHAPEARVYQASSSEMFGAQPGPQNESTKLDPRSPYAVAKVAAHHTARMYREAYGMRVSCGICFNAESPRRGDTFVTRKIVKAAVRIKRGEQSRVWLGNLDSVRDWGWAPEYAEAMWLMLQAPRPDDYVIATGAAMRVRKFADLVFSYVGLEPREHIMHDPRYERPLEVPHLEGDARKIHLNLGWHAKTWGTTLVAALVEAEQ